LTCKSSPCTFLTSNTAPSLFPTEISRSVIIWRHGSWKERMKMPMR
jgi:hypothetical protein